MMVGQRVRFLYQGIDSLGRKRKLRRVGVVIEPAREQDGRLLIHCEKQDIVCYDGSVARGLCLVKPEDLMEAK